MLYQQQNQLQKIDELYAVKSHSKNIIPVRFKGFILLSIMQRQRKKQLSHIREAIYQWYANKDHQKHKQAIFCMLTKTNSSLAFFYKIKKYVENQLKFKKKQKEQEKENNIRQAPSLNSPKLSKCNVPIQKKQCSIKNINIKSKTCIFAKDVIELSNTSQQEYSLSLKQKQGQNDPSSISLKVIEQNVCSLKQKKNQNHSNVVEYFQSLKNIFSIKLDKKNQTNNQYKKKQIKTEGQELVQIDIDNISSFDQTKKSISFCPSFSSSFKNIQHNNQDKCRQQYQLNHGKSKILIEKSHQIGLKVGIILTNTIASSICRKNKYIFFHNLTKFNKQVQNCKQSRLRQNLNEKCSQNQNQKYQNSALQYNQSQYDQRIQLIQRNIQLLDSNEKKQKQIMELYEELQVYHEQLLQIQEQFNQIQLNLKNNLFVLLDIIRTKKLRQAFTLIKIYSEKVTVFQTLNNLLQDSDPFDKFSQSIKQVKIEQYRKKQLSESQKSLQNQITSINLDQKENLSKSQASLTLQQGSKVQTLPIYKGILKYSSSFSNKNHFKRTSINIGTYRQLHKVYTLSSVNSQKSTNSEQKNLQISQKIMLNSSKLFNQQIKQLNEIEQVNNSSILSNFSN